MEKEFKRKRQPFKLDLNKKFKIEDEKKVINEMINRLPNEEVIRVKNFVFGVWRKIYPIDDLQKIKENENK